ncbi:ApeA N-terminal domain 1-containing protein [Spirosoma radiotolerans]|uniref:Uncharacterized protein n=1 Tax=Spirosoma radiotolerans TaxID=1379870 RepID=A0A0E3ZTN9_9BACT|nr:HEPN domain-containing protein [Spirosoma radiotolerans]AKD54038.1 hypothetical protein SD10_03080 [Spirosoma radiotolerans]
MTENREWIGKWTINFGEEERIFHGVLTYSLKSGGELKIAKEGAHWDEFFLLDQSTLIPIIKGYEYSTGKGITLINSLIRNYSVSSGVKITILPNLIIDNLDYADKHSLQFLTATVVYEGLGPWLAITGVTKSFKDDGVKFTGVTMEYNQPESLKFDIQNLFKIQIDFGYQPGDSRTYTGYSLKEVYYTNFIFKEPGANIHDLLKWVEHYRRLLTTLFGQPSFITSYSITNSLDITPKNTSTLYYKNTIDGFPNNAPTGVRMRTLYALLKTPLNDILNKWASYHLSNDLDYVAWIASKDFHRFSEETFLEVARSLEVFCGIDTDKKLYSDIEKKNLKKAIKDKISANDFLNNFNTEIASGENVERFNNMLEKLLSAVTYADSLSLRRKIKLALEQIKQKIEAESYEKLFPDSKSLINKIVDYRNYYTHYDEKSIEIYQGEELTIDQLVLLARKVKKIMLLLLLNDLGIPMQQAADSFIRLEVS